MTDAPNGLIHAKLLDGNGGARDVDWAEAMAWSPEQGCLWLHFDYEEESTPALDHRGQRAQRHRGQRPAHAGNAPPGDQPQR